MTLIVVLDATGERVVQAVHIGSKDERKHFDGWLRRQQEEDASKFHLVIVEAGLVAVHAPDGEVA